MKKITLFTCILVTLIVTSCQNSPNLEQVCINNNGTWLSEYNECESISKNICEANNGTFKECESACRHNPEATMCTMQCVQVCDFGNNKIL